MTAPTLSSLLATGSTTNASSYTTASITLGSGEAAILAIGSTQTFSEDPGSPTSLTLPSGISATLIGFVVAGTNDRMSVYWLTGSGTGTISFTFGSTASAAVWHLDKVTDPGTTPSYYVTASGTGTAVTSTLSGLTSGSSTWSVVWAKGQTTHSAESGWTQLATRVSIASPSVSSSTQYRADVTDSTPACTLGASNTWATLSLEIPAAVSAQTITAPLIASTEATYAPTITRGAVALTLALIASTATLHAPTITATGPAQSIALPLKFPGSTTYAPTVTRGAVTISVPLLGSTATLYAPTISAGGTQTITAPLIASTAALHTPTVTRGAVSLTAPLIASTAQTFAPTISSGPVAVSLPLLGSSATLHAPTVSLAGSASLSLPLIASTATLYTPTVSRGPVSVSLPWLASGSSLFPPVVSLDGVATVVAPFLPSGATLFPPTVTRGPVGISVPLLPSAATLLPPTITPGPASVAVPLLGSSATLFAPTISSAGSTAVAVPFLASTAVLYAPTVTTGAATLTVPLLASTATLYAPTITRGAVALGVPLLASTAALYAPAVVPGPVAVSLPLRVSSAVLYPPTVAPFSSVVVPLLGPGAVLFPPVVTVGAVAIVLPLHPGSSFFFAPSVSIPRSVSGTIPLPNTTIQVWRSTHHPNADPWDVTENDEPGTLVGSWDAALFGPAHASEFDGGTRSMTSWSAVLGEDADVSTGDTVVTPSGREFTVTTVARRSGVETGSIYGHVRVGLVDADDTTAPPVLFLTPLAERTGRIVLVNDAVAVSRHTAGPIDTMADPWDVAESETVEPGTTIGTYRAAITRPSIAGTQDGSVRAAAKWVVLLDENADVELGDTLTVQSTSTPLRIAALAHRPSPFRGSTLGHLRLECVDVTGEV